MASTNFIPRQTVISAAWLNDVDRTVYEDVVNVKNWGAVGDRNTDDTLAIQAAIDSIIPASWNSTSSRGGIVFLPQGTYRITAPLVLPAYVRLIGAGKYSTQLFLSNGANCDMIKTVGYDSFVGSGLSYYDTSGVPTGFSIEDMMLFGNKFNNSSGGGIKIYGYAFKLQNLLINASAGDALTTRWELGSDVFLRNYVKTESCHIENIQIFDVNGQGWADYGPTDGFRDAIFIGEARGSVGLNVQTSADYGLVHVYACGLPDGSNNPVGVYLNGNSRFSNLISEHNYGPGVQVPAWYVQCSNLQMYRNCRSYGEYNLIVDATAQYFSARNIEIKLEDVDAGGMIVSGPHSKFGNIQIIGTQYLTTNYTKTGFRQQSTAHYMEVDNLTVKDLRGVGAIGVALSQGGSTKGTKLFSGVIGCTTGISPGSGFSGASDISATIERAVNTQNYLTFNWPGTSFGRMSIVSIDELGNVAGLYDNAHTENIIRWEVITPATTLALGTTVAATVAPSGAPVNVTDITSSLTTGGIPRITIRNTSTTDNLVFIHNLTKLIMKSGADTTVAPYGSIQFVWVGGTVWAEV